MHHFLNQRPAWYFIGPAFGLIVVGVCATLNEQVGVLGGFSSIVERASGRAQTLSWKAWFVFGIVLGGLAFGLLSGTWGSNDYGWVTRTFDGGWSLVAGLVLSGPHRVETLYVGGEQVVAGRSLVRASEEEIAREHRKEAARLWR